MKDWTTCGVSQLRPGNVPMICGAPLRGTSVTCQRAPHSKWDHHEANRLEWWFEPDTSPAVEPEPFGHYAATEPTHAFVIGYAWCDYCGRDVTTFDGTCTRCFGRT